MSSSVIDNPAPVDFPALLPEVRLEVRQSGRQQTYTLSHIDYVLGTVPGCDLRLPGTRDPQVREKASAGLGLLNSVDPDVAAADEVRRGIRALLGAMIELGR